MNENFEFETNTIENEKDSQITAFKTRSFMFLEDGDWQAADAYCERILDIDPTNATAFLIKLLSENKIAKKEDILKLHSPLDNNVNYQKIVRFADEELKKEIEEYNEQIKTTLNSEKKKRKRIGIISSIALSAILFILEE